MFYKFRLLIFPGILCVMFSSVNILPLTIYQQVHRSQAFQRIIQFSHSTFLTARWLRLRNDGQLILNVVSSTLSQRKSECSIQKNTIKDQVRVSTARLSVPGNLWWSENISLHSGMTLAHTFECRFYVYFSPSTWDGWIISIFIHFFINERKGNDRRECIKMYNFGFHLRRQIKRVS